MVKINLTAAQHRKLMKGQGIQLSHAQLKNGSGEHEIDIPLDKRQENRLRRNVINGKGFRVPKSARTFIADKVDGALDSTARVAKRGVKKILDEQFEKGNVSTNQRSAIKGYLNNKIDGVKRTGKRLVKSNIRPKKQTEEQREQAFDEAEAQENFEALQMGNGFGSFVSGLKKVAKVAKPLAKVAAPLAAKAIGTYVGGPAGGEMASQMTQQGFKGSID
jgi:hypothetical protein